MVQRKFPSRGLWELGIMSIKWRCEPELRQINHSCLRSPSLNGLSFLSPVQTNTMAENYSLSGGQRENICRKITMQEVITGTKIDFREIIGFCDVELFGGNPKVKRIGFGR